MVDGIDGSGKSTVTSAIREWANACGHRTFDLAAWCKEHGTIPRFDEVADHDVFFSFEPTKAWVGAAVRYSAKDLVSIGSSDGVAPPTDLTVIEERGDRAIVEVVSPAGRARIELVRVDGRWLIDLPSYGTM